MLKMLIITIATLFTSNALAVLTTCFDNTQIQSTELGVCDPTASVSQCCPWGQFCYGNGLCHNQNETGYFVNGCTDSNGSSDLCFAWSKCSALGSGGSQLVDCKNGNWCCFGLGGCDCNNSTQVFKLPATASIITSLPLHSPTSTSSASISTSTSISSAVSSSSTPSANASSSNDNNSSAPPSAGSSSNNSASIAAGVGGGVAGAVLLLMIVGAAWYWMWRRKTRARKNTGHEPPAYYYENASAAEKYSGIKYPSSRQKVQELGSDCSPVQLEAAPVPIQLDSREVSK